MQQQHNSEPHSVAHSIDSQFATPKSRTLALIQAAQLLGLYRAEVATILECQCGDIGELFDGKRFLAPNTIEWDKSLHLIELYRHLDHTYNGDEILMNHWLRKPRGEERITPLYQMVDQQQITRLLSEFAHV